MTERRLFRTTLSEQPSTKRIPPRRPKCLVTQCMNKQTTIYVPIYISASLKELVNVNLSTKTVDANFLIYISIFLDMEEETFSMVKSKQIRQISQIKQFVQNNLKLQIGNKTVDIYFQHHEDSIAQQQDRLIEMLIKKKPTLKQVSSFVQHQNLVVSLEQFREEDEQYQLIDEDEEDQQIYDEQYVAKKMYSANSKVTNFFISGIFQCEFALNSSFFPYHQIKSTLKINIIQQYYKDIIIKYNMISPEESEDSQEQFNFVFPQVSFAKFGIYTVNFNYHKVISEKNNDIHYNLQRDLSISQQKSISLEFKVFSYNIPFILRNEVPVWILCFASLMLFYANADQISNIYGNTILLSVSFIFLLTNFRRSKYYANTFSLYEYTVSCFIIGDFLFIIDSTNHFYSHDQAKANEPSQMKLFHIYTGITLLGVFITIIVLAVLGILTFQRKFKLPDKSGHSLNHIWIQEFIAESEYHQQDNLKPKSSSYKEL